MPSRAAHGDDQLAFALFGVEGQQVVYQIRKAADKALRLLLLHDVVPHGGVQAGEGPQRLVVEGVGQAAHVKDQVGLHGDTELKPKADAVHRQGILGAGEEELGDAGLQLGRGHAGGVDDIVRALLDRLEHLPLQLDGLLQCAAHLVGEGVLAARLLEAVYQHAVGGIQEQDFIGLLIPLEGFQRREEGFEQLPAPGVRHHGGAVLGALGFQAQVVKHGNQRRGQVVHAEKADVLHGVHGPGFPRAGKAC